MSNECDVEMSDKYSVYDLHNMLENMGCRVTEITFNNSFKVILDTYNYLSIIVSNEKVNIIPTSSNFNNSVQDASFHDLDDITSVFQNLNIDI